jgi:predicted kinase
MKNILNLKYHTVLMYVGPSSCGKDYFTNNVLLPQIKEKYPEFKNVHVLSTDSIRNEILGNLHEYDKFNEAYLTMGSKPFNLLFDKLKNTLSFPNNADLVIINSTAIDPRFRESIVSYCKEYNYNLKLVVFDYNNRNDYFSNINNYSEEYRKRANRVTSDHVLKLKKELSTNISKSKYGSIFKVKSLESFQNIEIVIDDYDKYQTYKLSNDEEYVVIGDVHEDVDSLKRLILKNGFIIDENNIIQPLIKEAFSKEIKSNIILIGDFVDKGFNTKEIVDFIYLNKDNIKITLGNHENFVYKYLKGDIINVEKDVLEKFSSIPYLQSDEECRNKFFEIIDTICYPFLYNDYFILNHAPCENKYLLKIDNTSISNQVKGGFRYPKKIYVNDTEIDYEATNNLMNELLSPIFKTSEHSFIKVINGHINFYEVSLNKNRIFIDTGSVYGKRLSSISLFKSFKPLINWVDSNYENKNEILFSLIKEVGNYVNTEYIDSKDLNKIKRLINLNKVNFISGTMSPTNKLDNDIESLQEGIEYFRNKNINKLILQPKYMGSRCNFYLFNPENSDKNYCTSRNGFIIKNKDLSNVYSKLYTIFTEDYFKQNNINLIIGDGELLPWSLLSDGLIDNNFDKYFNVVKEENTFLEKTDFEKIFSSIKDSFNSVDYNIISKDRNKKELSDLLGNNVNNTYSNYRNYYKQHLPLEENNSLLQNYKNQLDIYSKEVETTIEPFSILKIVYNNGEEKNMISSSESNIDIFTNVLKQKTYLIADLNTNTCEAFIEGENITNKENDLLTNINNFYNILTQNQNMEGVVIKPEYVYNNNIAPYLKCRNKNYLTIVYGHDYLSEFKYNKLLNKKSINKKLRTSIEEFSLSKSLLDIKYSDLNIDNKDYFNLMCKLHLKLKEESTIDPRL